VSGLGLIRIILTRLPPLPVHNGHRPTAPTRCAHGCRVWVKSITVFDRASMPAYPDEQPPSERGGMSQTRQENIAVI
jgi:hypothetical protein